MMAWSCALCTFENAAGASLCAICEHPAAPTASKAAPSPASQGDAANLRASKKPKVVAQGRNKVQAMLAGVGSSREAEARRLQRKVQQMRELGIDLPTSEMLPLLARHCYSVPVAANAYFERMVLAESTGSAAHDDETAHRVEQLVAHFEHGFARDWPGFRLLGSTSMAATVTRSGAKLRAGQELVLQAENVGKKRLRPGGAGSASSRGSSPPTPPASVTANGFVRVLDTSQSQIGRLERELEVVLHPLMKEKLVVLGGMCRAAPLSTQMFAAFEVTVFVYVNDKVFAIFDEEHPQFYLADALYSLLEMLKPKTDSNSTSSGSDAVTASSDATANTADLDTLFSECVGANDMLTTTGGDQQERDVDPSEQLAPYLHDIELRDHQKQALRWMLWREQLDQTGGEAVNDADTIDPMWEERRFHGDAGGSYYVNQFEKIASLRRPKPPKPCLGGILADDMGMGKTMMMLSLIAHRKHIDASSESREPCDQRHRSIFERKRAGGDQEAAKTLIVCPLSLLHQWKNEVEERFRPRSLSVFVYYGDERDSASSSLSNADVVLTTYGVLSSQHDKAGTEGVLTRTAWRRVILDEAHSIKNRSTNYFRACAALQAQHRWCLTGTPIQNSLDDVFSLLSFLQYEPWSRVAWWKRVISRPFESGEAANALARLKAILTPVLLRRTKHSRDKRGQLIVRLPSKTVELVTLSFSPDERAFYRAVYDKSRAEFNGFVASGSAMSSYVAIFALLLRLRQACDHPLLALGRDLEQVNANDSGAAQKADNASALSSSFQFRPRPDESTDAYYRRISAQLQQDLQMTSSTLTVDKNGRQEEAPRTSVGTQGEGAASSGSGLTRAYIERVMTQVEDGLESQECPICLDPPQDGVLTPCAHVLCASCLRDSLSTDPEMGCPVCRAPVDMNKVFVLPKPTSEASEEHLVAASGLELAHEASAADPATATATNDDESSDDSDVFMSAKLRQLVHDLEAVRAEDKRNADEGSEPKRKVVVFSQWTLMLEMAAKVLARRGFSCSVFHGSMSQEVRERVLTAFAKDPSADVLVISLKAGGVGLNLTCASVVILLDPWWNPGVEEQAIDRVHRLGQARDVLVKRYVIDDTVEGMMLALQERKQALASHALVVAKDDAAGGGGRRQNERALNLDDLKRFFH